MGFMTAAERDAVDLYRITYRTITPTGRPTTATGLLALPLDGRHTALPTVEYTHGTMAHRGDAPSVTDGPDRGVAVMFAGQGFAAVAPDYLGLGLGPGVHPYMDLASETSASVDLLRAARSVVAEHGRKLDGRLLATGFSQGGVAAVGVARAVQDGTVPGFRLTGLAPVSGPYDVSGEELPAAFDGRLDPQIATFYLAYFITAWNRLHPLYSSPSQAFRAPYDGTVTQLFDGDHTDEQILAGLPATPTDLLTPGFIAKLTHPTGAFAAALRTADSACNGWTPRVPVHLFAAEGDRDVAYGNAVACDNELRAHGADVSLTDVGDVDHNHSALRSYPVILRWFEHLAG
jgi:predicted esterase